MTETQQRRVALTKVMRAGQYYQMTDLMEMTGFTSDELGAAMRPWMRTRKISKRENCAMRGHEYRLIRS